MTVNFRSRGEVLDAVDMTFEGLWGDDFDAAGRAPGARDEPPRAEPCVELLVTDREPQALARALPARGRRRAVRQPGRHATSRSGARPRRGCWPSGSASWPARAGPFAYGDCVMLLRATTHMGVYERALEDRGIPTHVLGGRGYWAQQQVADLRAYLAALANPLDELALHSVLASPLGGLSLDTLVVLAARSQARRARGHLARDEPRTTQLPGLIGGRAARAAARVLRPLPRGPRAWRRGCRWRR